MSLPSIRINIKGYLTLVTFIVLTVSACQSTNRAPKTTDNEQATEIKLDNSVEKAKHYKALADSAEGKKQAQFYLRAAHAFWHSNQPKSALNALLKIDHSQLSTAQNHELALLHAKLALDQGDSKKALAYLAKISSKDAGPTTQRQALKLSITAHELNKNWLEKANNHITITDLLADSEKIKNQNELWQALMKITPQSLSLYTTAPTTIKSGWFALAYIVQSHQFNPHALTAAIENWQRQYPHHPANEKFYKKILEAGTHLPQKLNSIAVLLPTKGLFSSQAHAIKQGIIAAHFNMQNDTKLYFFDITAHSSEQSNVQQQYQRAIDYGVDIVIGPLDKSSIRQLVDLPTLPIPVLALNHLSEKVNKKNLFQFGLAPEDDITTITNYALTKNLKRAIVIAPDNHWGDRIASNFSRQWFNKGGELIGRAHYNASNNDFSSIITPLLGLDASKKRAQKLRQTLSTEIEFEPRRRQDIDFILLVAKPLKARQLMSQLKFHRANNLLVMATSHAYNGYENTQHNIDLNHLIMSDIPWVLNREHADIYGALRDNNQPRFNQFIRLYALGVDAYRIIAHLNGLSRLPSLTVQGATGKLSINELGHVTRNMPLATFRKGKISLLAH